MKPHLFTLLAMGLLLAGKQSAAADAMENCVAQELAQAPDDATLLTVRDKCRALLQSQTPVNQSIDQTCLRQRIKTAAGTLTTGEIKAGCQSAAVPTNLYLARAQAERATENNPFVLSPLRQNYMLPYTYNNNPNQTAYTSGGESVPLDKQEAKLQLSVKVPLSYIDLLLPHDEIYFGFTLKSFWQVYNHNISAPFRETNYRPEFFYRAMLPINAGDGVWMGRIGLEHESNGRTETLSRSWNRVYITLGYATDTWTLALQPWYRIPEDTKDDAESGLIKAAKGDDNPDIQDYMGRYELSGAYKWNKLEFSGLFRRNFSTGKGAHEVGISFPLWGRLRGYGQYFDGYGESLIDYNNKNQRFGIGFLLTDTL